MVTFTDVTEQAAPPASFVRSVNGRFRRCGNSEVARPRPIDITISISRHYRIIQNDAAANPSHPGRARRDVWEMGKSQSDSKTLGGMSQGAGLCRGIRRGSLAMLRRQRAPRSSGYSFSLLVQQRDRSREPRELVESGGWSGKMQDTAL